MIKPGVIANFCHHLSMKLIKNISFSPKQQTYPVWEYVSCKLSAKMRMNNIHFRGILQNFHDIKSHSFYLVPFIIMTYTSVCVSLVYTNFFCSFSIIIKYLDQSSSSTVNNLHFKEWNNMVGVHLSNTDQRFKWSTL